MTDDHPIKRLMESLRRQQWAPQVFNFPKRSVRELDRYVAEFERLNNLKPTKQRAE